MKKTNSFTLKIVVSIAIFMISVLMLGEIYAVLKLVIPYVSARIFQDAGITIASGLTFSEFSVSDIVVLCMVWLFPCICGVALITAGQWKLICFVCKWFRKLLRTAFEPQYVRETKGDQTA